MQLPMWKSKSFESSGQFSESDGLTSRTARAGDTTKQVTSAVVTETVCRFIARLSPNPRNPSVA